MTVSNHIALCGPAACVTGVLCRSSVSVTRDIWFPFAIVKNDSTARGACQQGRRKETVVDSSVISGGHANRRGVSCDVPRPIS